MFYLAVSNGNSLFLLTLPPCTSSYHAGLKWLEQLYQKVFRHNRENQGPRLISWDPELEVISPKTSINHRLKSVKHQHSDNRKRCNLLFILQKGNPSQKNPNNKINKATYKPTWKNNLQTLGEIRNASRNVVGNKSHLYL